MRQETPTKTFSPIQHVLAACSYPGNMTRLTILSELNRLKSLGKKPAIHKDTPYDGQKILLMALYQKGQLRLDIRHVLEAAKAQGLYVICVNNLRLHDPASMDALCHMYVERYNYGRDFGSFKWGFTHVFRSGIADTCPRLMMINDSVFFSRERVPDFLDQLMSSEIEALGATENYEINHHLGSFCIALGGNVLRHPKFQKYWRTYRLSDVRPVVIKRGEMGLSKTLRRCISSEDQFQALYDSARYAAYLEGLDREQLEEIIGLMRRCQLTPAKRFSLVDTLKTLEKELSIGVIDNSDIQIGVSDMPEVSRSRIALGTLQELSDALNARLMGQGRIDPEKLRAMVVSGLVDNFRQHSQIHQNAAVLLHMGLPIVKLDCVYRGILNMLDVKILLSKLQTDEGEQLKRILYTRPFGGDVLMGWRRGAFLRGLI